MGLLAPLFLLGALAVAVPLWLHRLQTKSSNRQAFSSAMLLETTQQQVHVEKKLKYLLLLALRLALLLLIVGAFAKPYFDRPPELLADTGAGTRIVVLDASASMAQRGVFSDAQDAAIDLLDDAPEGAIVQAAIAAGRVRVAGAPSAERGEHRRFLADGQPLAERLPYAALVQQIERLAESAAPPVAVHLVSDFQASAAPTQFADLIADGVAEFVPHLVGSPTPNNAWIDTVTASANAIDLVVARQGDAAQAIDVALQINGERRAVRTLEGGGRQSVNFAALGLPEGQHEILLTLDANDDLSIDDSWHGIIAIEPPAPVPVITANRDGLPMTYLTAALGSIVGTTYQVEPLRIGDFDPRVLSRHRLAIVDDLGDVDEPLAAALNDYLQNGGNVLAFTGDATRSLQTLPLSNHEIATPDLESGFDGFAAIGQLDVRHPALAGTEGWHRVRVSESTVVEPQDDDELLIALDNGDALLVERAIGEGRLLLMLSALDNRWNDLPVHPVFVGFVFEAARYLTDRVAIKRQYLAGEALPLSMIGSASGQVVDPDGETILSLADTASAQLIRLSKPGVYAVYTALGETRVAVNVDPLESDLTRMADDVLGRWQELSTGVSDSNAVRTIDEGRNPLALWPWLLLFLAVIVIAESALGNVHIATTKRAAV